MNDVVIPAAIDITSCDGATRPAISSSIRSMSCGLTAMHEGLGLRGGLRDAQHRDAVGRAQLFRARGPAHHGGHLRLRAPRPEQPGQQRLAHLPRAEYRDHDCDPSERRKSARFAGRSASRRTR